jgi:CubicO group peptidase (beta-lactamase class C family)
MMNIKLKLVVFLLVELVLYTGNAKAQNMEGKLDSLFTGLSKNEMLNGAVLVAENGNVIYEKAFGYSNIEKATMNKPSTSFELASVSKVFTATAILQLKEKGKLSLNDKFVKYYPEFPYPEITIRQLLSHTSGMSDQDIAEASSTYFKKLRENYTNAQLIPLLAEANIQWKLATNEKWWYCNTGYALLAALVEKLSKKSFNDYLTDNIFKKAGMNNTYLKSKFLPSHDSTTLAGNYDYEFRYSIQRIKMEGKKSYYNGASYGAANIISTLNDLLKFDNALYNGTLLSGATLDEAYTATILSNGCKNAVWLNIGGMGNSFDGLGWFAFEDTSAGKVVWHTGGMPGCATIFLRNITKRQTIIILDNFNSEGIYKSALNAMNILNSKPISPAKKSLTKVYGKAMMNKGESFATSLLLENRKNIEQYNFLENDMNNLGYDFLSNNLINQALETFKVNALLYPESDNTYNSYGEALLKAGKKEESKMMYKKSLQINPQNTESLNSLRELEGK